MAFVRIGTSEYGLPLYQDSFNRQDCYTLEDDTFVYYGDCPNYGFSDGMNNQIPPINTPNVSTGGVLIQHGQSWYEDLLNSLLGLSAIGQGATHIPSTAHQIQPQMPSYIPNLPPSGIPRNDQGGEFGSDIQKFITKNFTWIAIGGLAFILYRSGRK